MKIKYLSILIIVFLAACKKDGLQVEDSANKNLNEISVSPQFDWKTTRDVNFSFGVSDSRFAAQKHVITVYNDDPNNGGQIISKGSATHVEPYNAKIALPITMTQVYVVKTSPDASKVSGLINITSTNVSVAISENAVIGSVAGSAARANGKLALANGAAALSSAGKEVVPTIPSNAITLTNSNIVAGNNYKISSGEINNINGTQATIYVEGNVTLGVNFGNKLAIVVMPGSVLNLQNANYNGEYTIKNFGVINGLDNNFKVTSGSLFYNDNQNLTLNGFQISGTLVNFGKLTINGNLDVSGSLKNEGTIDHKSNLNTNGSFVNGGKYTLSASLNAAGSFNNSGEFIISGTTTNNFNNGSVYNTGVFRADHSKVNISTGAFSNSGVFGGKELNFTGDSNVANFCHIYSLTNAIFDGYIDNYSYIYVGEVSNINGSTRIRMFNEAMFSTDKTENLAGIIEGAGQKPALFKIRTESDKKINNDANTAVFTGNLFVSDKNRVNTVNKQNGFTSTEVAAGKFSGAAKLIGNTNVYIPKTSCNAEGNGTAPAPVKPDTDGDGIIDEEDDYPNDPEKAFKNYSVNYSAGGSSVAFEDSWPLKGDYDLNDIVITYRYMIVTNAQNKVVQVNANYKLLATGGKFNNGAGIQFNLPAASAKNFSGKTGTYLESGQDSVVVILFEDSRKEQETWNTNPGEAASPVMDYSISFDVTNGPLLSAFGISSYNPFIWNNTTGYGRGYETHLLGKKATNKVNSSLFGTGDDNSITGKTYSTHDNLPWALEIPTAPFRYPKERVAITDVYLKFAQWASSSGSQYPDWYTNTGSGYVNNSLIY